MNTDEVARRAADLMPSLLDDLARLVAIPSVAFPGYPAEPVERMARETLDLVRAAGFAGAELMSVPSGYPPIYAEVPGPPGSPVVVLYAHYDVQPAPASQGWSTDPWTATRKADGRIYGRGAADDKGGLIAHLGTMRVFEGRPPCTVRLIVEGMEETESNLPAFVLANPELFTGDVVIVCDMGNLRPGEPVLTTTLRGDVACVVTVSTLKHPLHSGVFGGPAPDAMMALARLLATLHDDKGDVAVAGVTRNPWPTAARDPSESRSGAGGDGSVSRSGAGGYASVVGSGGDREASSSRLGAGLTAGDSRSGVDLGASESRAGADLDQAEFRSGADLLDGVALTGSGSLAARLWASPSISAIGVDMTSVADSSNVLVPTARAKLSMRIVPGTDPEQELDALIAHLTTHVPWGAHLEVERTKAAPPFTCRTDGPGYEAARRALEDAYGKPPSEAGNGASIPLLGTLQQVAPDAEFILWGPEDIAHSRIHASDESVDPTEIEKLIVAQVRLIARLSER